MKKFKTQIVNKFICNLLSCVSNTQANARLVFLEMLHASVGETHVNNLLAAINAPFVHHKTLKRRKLEAGKGLESLARETVQEALHEEIERSLRSAYNLLNSSFTLLCSVFL